MRLCYQRVFFSLLAICWRPFSHWLAALALCMLVAAMPSQAQEGCPEPSPVLLVTFNGIDATTSHPLHGWVRGLFPSYVSHIAVNPFPDTSWCGSTPVGNATIEAAWASIEEWRQANACGKVVFVGHSLGGIAGFFHQAENSQNFDCAKYIDPPACPSWAARRTCVTARQICAAYDRGLGDHPDVVWTRPIHDPWLAEASCEKCALLREVAEEILECIDQLDLPRPALPECLGCELVPTATPTRTPKATTLPTASPSPSPSPSPSLTATPGKGGACCSGSGGSEARGGSVGATRCSEVSEEKCNELGGEFRSGLTCNAAACPGDQPAPTATPSLTPTAGITPTVAPTPTRDPRQNEEPSPTTGHCCARNLLLDGSIDPAASYCGEATEQECAAFANSSYQTDGTEVDCQRDCYQIGSCCRETRRQDGSVERHCQGGTTREQCELMQVGPARTRFNGSSCAASECAPRDCSMHPPNNCSMGDLDAECLCNGVSPGYWWICVPDTGPIRCGPY
jgi:hypothetical protein